MNTATIDATTSKVVRMLSAYQGEQMEDVAHAIGMERSKLYRRLSGKSSWMASEVGRLADHFGVSVSMFYEGPEGLITSRLCPPSDLVAA